jgi:hypothetical protein
MWGWLLAWLRGDIPDDFYRKLEHEVKRLEALTKIK